MKNSLKYILLVLVFIVFVASITISVLFTKYKEQGNFNVSRKKFDIVFTNVIVESDNIKVKLDNNNKSIHIDASNIESEEEISLDIRNVANTDGVVKNYSISNVDTNDTNNKIEIITSVDSGTIIKKGESKKLFITIKNNSKDKNVYYNFNINYLFEESLKK